MKTRFLKTTAGKRQRSIALASRLIREGGLVAFPTETVYGLGASVYNPAAIRRIFKVKGRPQDNPMIVHIWSIDQVAELADSVPVMFYLLAEHFFPGPLTLLLKRSRGVPDVVTAGLPTVAVRMPDHPIARAFLRQAAVPIVAPSANLSGKPSPTSAIHVRDDLDGTIDAILDGGRCRIGVESTVLDITRKHPIILRPGGVPREELEDVLHTKIAVAHPGRKRPLSPGMKYIHYAPEADVILFEGEKPAVLNAMRRAAAGFGKQRIRVGIMASANVKRWFTRKNFFSLGTSGALGAAQRLFEGFRRLDRQGVQVILCQGFTDENIGSALMNRMRKAAKRRIRV